MAPSLADLCNQCYGALLEGSIDHNQLVQFPQQVLAQVLQRAFQERLEATARFNVLKAAEMSRDQALQRAVQERLEAIAQLDELKAAQMNRDEVVQRAVQERLEATAQLDLLKADQMERDQALQRAVQERLEATVQLDVLKAAQVNRYQVDPGMKALVDPGVAEKVYKRAEATTAKWAPVQVDPQPDISSDFSYQIRWNTKSKSFKVYAITTAYKDEHKSLGSVISSAMLLYRLCCLLPVKAMMYADGADGYKTVWTVELMHLETGKRLILKEWKAVAEFRTIGGPFAAGGQFENDVVELLNLLCDPNCLHPFGWVAGTMPTYA